MSIYKSIVAEIEHFGEEIIITTQRGCQRIKGILQPLLYKNKMYLGGKQLPSGFFDSGHYLLICGPDADIPVMGDVVFDAKDKTYILKRCEKVKVKSGVFYNWAVLCPYENPSVEEVSYV